MTEAQARDFIAYFEAQAQHKGWTVSAGNCAAPAPADSNVIALPVPPFAQGDGALNAELTARNEGDRAELLADLPGALACLPPDDYDTWIAVGQALKPLAEDGLGLWEEWSQRSSKWQAADANRWDTFKADRTGPAAIFARAARLGWVNPRSAVAQAPVPEAHESPEPDPVEKVNAVPAVLADFHAFLPVHKYIYTPTHDLWPPQSVDGNLPKSQWPVDQEGRRVRPSQWLDVNRPVYQMTWHPGMPQLIRDQIVAEGGLVPQPGAVVFNQYRPPRVAEGDPALAGRWLDLLYIVYGSDAPYLIQWFAHRVQRPGEKINNGIVLGGNQGVGKDSILVPVVEAVGPWNVTEVSPAALLGRFNPYVRSVILRISEARDPGDVDRFVMYDRTKVLMAAPPDVLTVDEKNIPEHKVFNVTGVIITTNHLLDGIYLPADDRRHFVAWSEVTRDRFSADYWREYHRWLATGGNGHVAAYLRTFDLSDFDAKAPPPRTAAFQQIVQANHSTAEIELADVIEALGRPCALTREMLVEAARRRGDLGLVEELEDRRFRRSVPHRFDRAGYLSVANPDAGDGLWSVGGRRKVVYARRDLVERDRLDAARQLAAHGHPSTSPRAA